MVGRTAEGGVTRLSYRAEHTEATRLAARWMQEAGAEVGLDRWGNLFGIVPGSGGALPPLAAVSAPFTPLGLGQPLHLRTDPDALAGGDYRAYPCHQAFLPAVLEQRPE